MQIDKELLDSCLNQNPIGQKQLYRLLLPYLRAIAYRYLRDNSYSKDVLQESFVRIFLNIDTYDSKKAPLEKWAARIVINSCLNYNDRVIGIPKSELGYKEYTIAVEPEVLQYLSEQHLIEFLKRMPSDYYDVFNLFVIDGYTHLEVAELLGVTTDLSRKRLSRARMWIKKVTDKATYLN